MNEKPPTPEYMAELHTYLDALDSPADRNAFIDWIVGKGVEGLLHGDPEITVEAVLSELSPAIASLALRDGTIAEIGQAIFLGLLSREYSPSAVQWLQEHGIGIPEVADWLAGHPNTASLAPEFLPARKRTLH